MFCLINDCYVRNGNLKQRNRILLDYNNKKYSKPQKSTTANHCSEMKNKTKHRYCPQPNTFVHGNDDSNNNIQKQTICTTTQ